MTTHSLPPDLKIISADDHMDLNVLPPDLWQARLPERWRAVGPRVVASPEGPIWEAEGVSWGPSGRKEKGYLEKKSLGFRPANPRQRLEDMDVDGVYAQVIYGPPRGFATQDPELRVACLRAYNDWALEFNRANPNRLVALPMLPADEPVRATEELVRVAKQGHKGVQMSPFLASEPIFETAWEGFWATAAETGLPVCVHIGGGYHSLRPRANSWRNAAWVTILPIQLDEAFAGLLFSGIFERHPRLRVVMVECGLGWLPYLLERLDMEYRKYYDTIQDYRQKEPPSAYFRRQIWVTYEEDPLGIELIDRLGADRVMWASDYPHGDTTWPHSRRAIAESLARLSESDRRKVVSENAAGLFGIE